MPNLTRFDAEKITVDVCKRLDELNAEYCFSYEFRNNFSCTAAEFCDIDAEVKNCDAVIAVGGDGSIIHGAKIAAINHKPILGINAGRLAFMAGIESDELDLLSRIIDGDYSIDRRLVLKADIIKDNEVIWSDYCVNDCYITNEEKQRMSAINVMFNSGEAKDYICDGIVVATPTGSTAYSLSAGGPVVDPELESILVTPVCPHSLVSRSLIFRADALITVFAGEGQILGCSTDGQKLKSVDSSSRIEISAADFTADFIRIKPDNFIDKLYKKLAQRN